MTTETPTPRHGEELNGAWACSSWLARMLDYRLQTPSDMVHWDNDGV